MTKRALAVVALVAGALALGGGPTQARSLRVARPYHADVCSPGAWVPAYGCLHAARTRTLALRWASSFERSDVYESFDGHDPTPTQPGQPRDEPIGPVAAGAAGIPPDVGSRVMRFPMDPADARAGRIHSKLYKTWNIDGPGAGWPGLGGDVSGVYGADVYWPADRALSCDDNATTGLVGWKEVAHHRRIQDSTWWLTVAPACWAWDYPGARWVGPRPTDPDAPVMFTRYWNYGAGSDDAARAPLYVMAVPRGRWFGVRAALHDHAYIDWTVDGRSLGRSENSEYPVGPQYGRASDDQWTFEIGNYGNGKALGTTYFDRVFLARLP